MATTDEQSWDDIFNIVEETSKLIKEHKALIKSLGIKECELCEITEAICKIISVECDSCNRKFLCEKCCFHSNIDNKYHCKDCYDEVDDDE